MTLSPRPKNGLDHEQSEALGQFRRHLGRHRQLLPGDHGIDQRRPVMSERGTDGRLDLLGPLDTEAADAGRLGHRREIRVFQLHPEIEEAGRLLLELDEA